MKLDLHGNMVGARGSQGKLAGQYGEAHFLAPSEEDIYAADTLNWRVQKLVKK